MERVARRQNLTFCVNLSFIPGHGGPNNPVGDDATNAVCDNSVI